MIKNIIEAMKYTSEYFTKEERDKLLKHNIDIIKTNFDIEISYYGIIASLKTPPIRQTSTSRNTNYIFNITKKNGFEIPLLNWNPNTKLPLQDIHRKISA